MSRPPRRVSFDEIKLALPSLTPEQRRELGQWCQVPGGKKSTLIPLDADDWYADAVRRWALRRGLTTRDEAWLFVTIAANRVRDYRERSAAMRAELAALAGAEGGTALARLGDLLVSAVSNMLKSSKLPRYIIDQLDEYYVPAVVIKDIERRFSRQPINVDRLMRMSLYAKQALDNELPGYIAGGMLPLALTSD